MAIRSATGDSVKSIIDVLEPIHGARFTNWNLGAFGDTITDASPPVGASTAYRIGT